ncbi:hypothetical protein [Microcystis aeruginosa]|uniref:hypothetical protein n=1 Tax=Microcystis aeruginosa TaxID=1126 RepID=UPI00130532CA|nr:hypothetical protein [Microcystis aeruginosa]
MRHLVHLLTIFVILFNICPEKGSPEWGVGCGVWGVGCGVWGVGRINKNNLLTTDDRRPTTDLT